MCVDPMTALTIGGTALSGGGSLLGGFQQSASYQLQAKIAAANAQTALAETSGRMGQIDQRVGQTIGKQNAYYAGGNLNLQAGSPLLMQGFSASQGNTDKQLTLARGLNTASGMNFTAGQDEQRSSAAMTAGIFGAGTALLGGLAKWKGLGGFGVGNPMSLNGGMTGGYVSADPYGAFGAPNYQGAGYY